jgi:hypothetical protein
MWKAISGTVIREALTSAYASLTTWMNVMATGIMHFSTGLMSVKDGRKNMELCLMAIGVLGTSSR